MKEIQQKVSNVCHVKCTHTFQIAPKALGNLKNTSFDIVSGLQIEVVISLSSEQTLRDAPLDFKGWAGSFFNQKNTFAHTWRKKEIDPHMEGKKS